jgi:hypothetical protein
VTAGTGGWWKRDSVAIPPVRERLLAELLYPVRDTVLHKAKLQPGDIVFDVDATGSGDGGARCAMPGL